MNTNDDFLNIVREMDKHPGEVVNSFITGQKSEKILDTWTGIVIDNNDPNKQGRVKIKILGYYDDIDDIYVPWAVPDIGFIGSTNGSFIVPEIKTVLRGYFDKGDIQKPVYTAIAYTEKSDNSFSFLDASKNDYPNTLVLFDSSNGDTLTFNRNTAEMIFKHRSGTCIILDKNGSITLNVGADIDAIGGKNTDLNIKVNGSSKLEINGNVDLKADGDVNIETVTEKSSINIGNNSEKQLVNNLPTCLICGAMHAVGNTQVKV